MRPGLTYWCNENPGGNSQPPRAKAKTATLVDRMPVQAAVVEPERDFEEAAGVSSHYDQDPDNSKPGIYRIQLDNWKTETRGDAEITVVHEA